VGWHGCLVGVKRGAVDGGRRFGKVCMKVIWARKKEVWRGNGWISKRRGRE